MYLCCINLVVWFRCIIFEMFDVLSGYYYRGSGKIGLENVIEIFLIKLFVVFWKFLGSKYYY